MNNMDKHGAIQSEHGDMLLRSIMVFSLSALTVFVAGGWFMYNWTLAQSIIAGGILANGSFYLLKKDIEQLISRVSAAGNSFGGVKRAEKIRFVMKFYARLIVLGLLLLVLATKIHINMIGLVIGLSTVMLSVVVVVLSKGRTYSVQREGV